MSHIAIYNGKCVSMAYVGNPKREFRAACQRIIDNGADGYVVTPKREVYTVQRSCRSAKPASNDERNAALATAEGAVQS